MSTDPTPLQRLTAWFDAHPEADSYPTAEELANWEFERERDTADAPMPETTFVGYDANTNRLTTHPAAPAPQVKATIANSKTADSRTVELSISKNRAGMPKGFTAGADLTILNSPAKQGRTPWSAESIDFTGTTTLFMDQGIWNVRLSDGDLERPVRFQPGKDSTNAKTLAKLALRTQWDRHVETIRYTMINDENVFVDLDFDGTQIQAVFRAPTRPLPRVIFTATIVPTDGRKGRLVITPDTVGFDAPDRVTMHRQLVRLAKLLVEQIDEFSQLSYTIDWPESAEMPEINLSVPVEDGTITGIVVNLAAGSSVGHASAMLPGPTGFRCVSGVFWVQGGRSELFMDAEDPIGQALASVLTGVLTSYRPEAGEVTFAKVTRRHLGFGANNKCFTTSDHSSGYVMVHNDAIEGACTAVFALSDDVVLTKLSEVHGPHKPMAEQAQVAIQKALALGERKSRKIQPLTK